MAELDNDKTVAVKFLFGTDLPTMKQFAAEVDIMRACRDDNIVGFLGAWMQQVLACNCTTPTRIAVANACSFRTQSGSCHKHSAN